MSRPPLVIAGAQRSASTSLVELFRRHPGIEMPPHEVVGLEDPNYPHRLKNVERVIERARRANKVGGFKRPELLHRPEAAGRVARHLPGAVVLIGLREPVSRTVSAYDHYLRYGLIPDEPLNRGLRRLLDDADRGARWTPGADVVSYSNYSAGVDRFLSETALTVLVEFHDDLVADPAPAVRRVLEHLELEPLDLGPLPRSNERRGVDWLGLERAGGRAVFSIDEDRQAVGVTRSPVRRLVAQAARQVGGKLPVRPSRAEPLDPTLEARLVERFAPDVARLADRLERPVPPAWLDRLRP